MDHCIVRGAEEVDRIVPPADTVEVTVPRPVHVSDGTYQLVLTVYPWCAWNTSRLLLIGMVTSQNDLKVLCTVYLCFWSEQFMTSVKTPTGHPGDAAEILRCVLDVAHAPAADAGVDSSESPARTAMPSTTMLFNSGFLMNAPFSAPATISDFQVRRPGWRQALI